MANKIKENGELFRNPVTYIAIYHPSRRGIRRPGIRRHRVGYR